MVENRDLKKIFFLENLSDRDLDKIGAIAKIEEFEKEKVLFSQNRDHNLLYMLLSGQVSLKMSSTSGKTFILDELSEGQILGISTLIGEPSSSFTAECGTRSSFITVSSDKLRVLLRKDSRLGNLIMSKAVYLFKKRKDKYIRKFLNLLASHLEIRKFE